MDYKTFLNNYPSFKPPFFYKPLSGGNMNEVALINSSCGKEVVIKHAPPYLHMLGPSFPLAQERIHVEMHALEYFNLIAPDFVPSILYKNEASFFMLLEYKKGFKTLQENHIKEQFNPRTYEKLGHFLSLLCMNKPPKKPKTFYENSELKSITNEYVFTIAFLENSDKTMPHPWFEPLPKSKLLLKNANHLKSLFNTPFSSLIHGDLHTGSVLVNGNEIAVIDAEFALFGPISFDIGNLFAHFILDGFGRNFPSKHAIEVFWDNFTKNTKFSSTKEAKILSQSIGFCGIEIARRLVVPAKSPALETLKDKEKAYASMDALSHKLIEDFTQIKTLQEFLGILP